MWAINRGVKKNGFSVNGQYYLRWLSDFDADGPLPFASTLDHGFELSAGQFIVPKTLVAYARGSKVFGQFASPYEYAGGLKWYFAPDRTFVAYRRTDAGSQSPLQQGLYAFYRRHDRVDADAPDRPGFLGTSK